LRRRIMAQFLDKVKIVVQSGAGGNGMVAWRREKFVPMGGPAGGDGGRGGHIILEATSSLNTLLDFKYQSRFTAIDGEKGRTKNQHGKGGDDLVIKVPCGTVVRDLETGNAIADLTTEGDRVMVASGGRGGRGNSRFLSATRQAPQFSEPGEPGIVRELELELKLIADVGIIGFPNAGKSTLISVISAAKPKIADYPFTTLTPNLGVVRKPDGNGVVVADIPGLIEGASEGAGLGHEFLRHVERTRLLLHLIDLSCQLEFPDQELVPLILSRYDAIAKELQKYKDTLANKPQVIVLSKADALLPEEIEACQKALADHTGQSVRVISSITKEGLEDLLKAMFDLLAALPEQIEVVAVVPDAKAEDHDDSAFEIEVVGKTFVVHGGKVHRLVNITDLRNQEALFRLTNIMKAMGVYAALAEAGAQEGDSVVMGGIEFEYLPEA
jgi:GTPase